ncbi:MAG: hypothetical protein KAH01_01315 [Caldisericia bacterium]|nr:hypothetical protein [Caldisericia bacterium]
MTLTSCSCVSDWYKKTEQLISDNDIETETKLYSLVSVSLMEKLAFFILDVGYQSEIDQETATVYLSFVYNLLRSIVMFGYSEVSPIKEENTRLSLMHADFYLANAAVFYGKITNKKVLKESLKETLFLASKNLKTQMLFSKPTTQKKWEKIQFKRFSPFLRFYIDALIKCYNGTEISDKEFEQYVYCIAMAGDPIYVKDSLVRKYAKNMINGSIWEVTNVSSGMHGRSFSLPISKRRNEE